MMVKRLAVFLLAVCCLFFVPSSARAQDWFKTGTGMGVEKARIAVPEFAARTPTTPPLEKVFHDVLWSDLNYSGILELVSPSFYPTQVPSQPSDLNANAWSQAPTSAFRVAFGNLNATGNDLSVFGWLNDVRNPTAPPALAKAYRGTATEADARRFAHQFADEIISRLSGGIPGISSTQNPPLSTRSGIT